MARAAPRETDLGHEGRQEEPADTCVMGPHAEYLSVCRPTSMECWLIAPTMPFSTAFPADKDWTPPAGPCQGDKQSLFISDGTHPGHALTLQKYKKTCLTAISIRFVRLCAWARRPKATAGGVLGSWKVTARGSE